VGCDDQFAKENEAIAKSVFKNDFPDYLFLQVPGGTNSVGTIRRMDPDKPFSEWRLAGEPGTWFADGVSVSDRASWMAKIVKTGTLGSYTLQQTIAQNITIGAALPDIKQIVNANISADISQNTTINIGATNITQQEINFGQLCDAKQAGKLSADVASDLESNRFVIVQSAIVYGGYKLIVDATNNNNVSIALKAAASSAKVLGQDAGLNLTVSDQGNSHFEITDNDPVVVAYLPETPTSDAPSICPVAGGQEYSATVRPKLAPYKLKKSDRKKLDDALRFGHRKP